MVSLPKDHHDAEACMRTHAAQQLPALVNAATDRRTALLPANSRSESKEAEPAITRSVGRYGGCNDCPNSDRFGGLATDHR
jgi:hypothetical protein